jgi:hypothetical protein
MSRSPDLSPGGLAAPIYVVDRTDIVRIFVDVPERDANYVKIGTKATVKALPRSALTYVGGKSFYWRCENGHALRTEVQTGVTDGEWIEVTNRRLPTKSSGGEQWAPIDGSEQVLLGKLSTLTEKAPVRLSDEPAPTEGESANPSSGAPEVQ